MYWAASGDALDALRAPFVKYPNITVEPDAIYVRDGAIWSSAGVTTGIDLVTRWRS